MNHNNICDNIMTIFHYTNLSNVYNVYKDNATQEKEKIIKEHIENDEIILIGKLKSNTIWYVSRPAKVTTISLIKKLNLCSL